MKASTTRICASVALFTSAAALLMVPSAEAAIIATVPLATAAEYNVLAGSTVTNTGPTTMGLSLGVHPGLAVVGFPPGQVVAPGTTHAGDANALQAQSDLTTAYVDAAGRPVDQTGPAELAGLNLQAGTYATSGKGALLLSGNIILDGAGDPTSVFIFQTDSTLITGSASTVTLINGAQECNVFWQVGSSATLGTGSTFVGNILALTSISVSNSVTVHGRALARNGAVTLDNDTFTVPTCETTTPAVTTTAAPSDGSASTVPGQPGADDAGADDAGAAGAGAAGAGAAGAAGDAGLVTGAGNGTPDATLPRTGSSGALMAVLAACLCASGGTAIGFARRR
jgi:hypothetical protein